MVTMDDGVNITLLWFEAADAGPDVPVVVSLHGIGKLWLRIHLLG